MKNLSVVDTDGDQILSGNDHFLWSLVYHIVLKFHCLAMFTTFGPDVPRNIDYTIRFFVPFGRPDVTEYLTEELKDVGRESKFDKYGLRMIHYGTKVEIYEFSGIQPYFEREAVHEVAEKALRILSEMVTKSNKKTSKKGDIVTWRNVKSFVQNSLVSILVTR